MYRSFSAINYRSFQEINLDDLGRINLITGLNNAGKTNLLEGILLCASGSQAPLVAVRLLQARSYPPTQPLTDVTDSPWTSYFANFNTSESLKLKLFSGDEGTSIEFNLEEFSDQEQLPVVTSQPGIPGTYTVGPGLTLTIGAPDQLPPTGGITNKPIGTLLLKVESNGISNEFRVLIGQSELRSQPAFQNPSLTATLVSARQPQDPQLLAREFSSLQIRHEEKLLVDALKLVDPDIEDLQVVMQGLFGILWVRFKDDRLLPMPLAGDGLNRVANIAVTIIKSRNGIVLVDEIENGIHYSVMKDVWSTFQELAKRHNVQLFATTHSSECIRAALEGLRREDTADEGFKVFRLERDRRGKVNVYHYDEESLESAFEMNLEVR